MHVNPDLKEKGLAIFYNPTDKELTRKISIPLYYTGLRREAKIREKECRSRKFKLNCDDSVELTVTIPANGYTWYVIE